MPREATRIEGRENEEIASRETSSGTAAFDGGLPCLLICATLQRCAIWHAAARGAMRRLFRACVILMWQELCKGVVGRRATAIPNTKSWGPKKDPSGS